jgi:excinuclease ABC subunit C
VCHRACGTALIPVGDSEGKSEVEVSDHVRGAVDAVPRRPGVYLMRDGTGEVIYVGKAVDLRSRVRSYFHSASWENPKVRALVCDIADLEFIITDSELEALILEANLIKQHRPRYNVRLKDDKRYPYIKITWAESFPKVEITRRMELDGGRYFGPFTSSQAVHQTLDLLRRSFPYRTCNRKITGQDKRPCLYYDIKLCLGPCIGAVTPTEYRTMLQGLAKFLEGRSEEVIEELESRMEAAADRLDFEGAAAFRDQLRSAQRIVERQKIVSSARADQDVIAFARDDGDTCVQVFFIRAGKLLGREYFLLDGAQHEDDKSVLTAFLKQFYGDAAYVPAEVLLPHQVDEAMIIERWLRDRRGAKVALRVPRRGKRRDLVRMATENASETLGALQAQWQADAHKQEQALMELQEALHLAEPPARIECYDISTTQGTEIVGSMVVFVRGVPRKSAYRRFIVRSVEGQDDYASMREVLRRRFRRWSLATSGEMLGTRDIKGWAKLPDLIIVDGGVGQLNVGTEVLTEFGLQSQVSMAGLAKRQEEIFLSNQEAPVILPRRSQGLFLMQRIRDEAHRFAITHHRVRRRHSGIASQLDSIPGVGPARRRALLKSLGSIEAIRQASVEDLARIPGIPRRVAEAVKEHVC